MRHPPLFLTVALIASAAGCRAPDATSSAVPLPAIRAEVGVREDGTATPAWTEGIAVAIGLGAAEGFAREPLPFTPEASAWLEVLRDSIPAVRERAPQLASWFDMRPMDAIVVAGNRGSSDGFAWLPDHIGINVQAFHATYGPPAKGAVDRMTRIVAHEYLHLLTYAFYPDHRTYRTTPLDRALWTMFFEGIGDYVSVSERWKPDENGNDSEVTVRTLEQLEPILVERLEALVDATPEQEKELRRGISMGKFDRKWGSLPVALWLHREAARSGERETLERMIREGRDGVLPLALRHAAPALRPRLEALRAAQGR